MGKDKPHRDYGEGSITERKDGRWQVSVPGVDGKRRYDYASSSKEAEKLRRQLLSEVEQGKLPPSKQPFKAHYEEWIAMRKDFKPNTHINMTSCFNKHFLPAFGHIPLCKLTPGHIQKLYNRLLDQGMNPNTIRTNHTRLKLCLNVAVRQGKLNDNPCSRVELPKKRKAKNGCLTAEEAMQVMEACAQHPLLSMLVPLALATEARESELLALAWEDVDFEKGTIRVSKTLTRSVGEGLQTVVPKSSSSIREITLPGFAIDVLRNHWTAQRKKSLASGIQNKKNLVFPNRKGDYIWPTAVWNVFTRIITKLGLDDITFHDLRHTGATLLLEQGVSAVAVQKRLGHSDVKTTLSIYGHATKRMENQTANTLENLFSGEKNAKSEAN